ncbi:MAG: hypothetical protein MJZ34_14480 [Paludibacteraceae bacterium]|nr:hypothetical protein [Paludibacteraceae bacterium]
MKRINTFCPGCLQDTISCTYNELFNLFGESNPPSGDDKVMHSWTLQEGDSRGEVYDWKDSAKYNGIKNARSFKKKFGYGEDEVYSWHIGASTPEDAAVIKDALLKLLNK